MPLLPLFLTLSLLLHAAAGFFLLGRDMAVYSVAQPSRAVQPPAVVQVMLAPAEQRPVAVKAVPPVSKAAIPQEKRLPRQPAKMHTSVAKPQVKPATTSTLASAAQPAQTASAASAAVPAKSPVPAGGPPAQVSAAPAEVFSRTPAFRLPPQQPRYPAQARRRNQQGVVLLEVRLDERGAQRDIKLIRSSGFPSLDSAALEAVADWRFHPETINGKGVPSRVQIPIEFALLASR